MTYLDFLEQKVLLERLVIGLEEPVLIKGLGELSAKIDSGNGGYNVIHGTDFHQQGNELMFTTHDSFGHEKKMQATVIDTIEVNMGGGNIENRPVIELDIKFAGEDYKKIPFSVSDRSTNTNPILISKGFVEKELEALIDVGAKNISSDGIDVVYGESVMLDEGVLGAIGKGLAGAAKGIGKGALGAAKLAGKGALGATKLAAKGAIGAAKTVTGGNGVLGSIANFGKWLGGDAKMKDWASPLTNNIKSIFSPKNKNLINQIKEVTNIENEDKVTITPKTNSLTVFKNIAKDPNADLTNNIVELWNANKIKKTLPICLVTSFMMCKGSASDKKIIKGLEKDRETLKTWITDSKDTIDEVKGEKKPNVEEQEEGVPEQPNQTGQLNQSQEGIPEQPANDGTQGEQQTSNQDNQQQENNQEKFEEITTFLEDLCNFTLWFISIEKVKNENKYQKEFKNYIQSGKFDETLYKIFKSGGMSPKTIESHVKKLAELFQKDGKQGFFALCWTPLSQSELKDDLKDIKRQTYFYEKLDYVAYQKKASNSPKFDQAEKQIQQDNGIEEHTDDELTDEPEGEQDGEVTDEQTVEEPTGDGTTNEEVQDDQQQTDQVVDEEPPVTTDTTDEITDTPQVVDEQPVDKQPILDEKPVDKQPVDVETTEQVKEPAPEEVKIDKKAHRNKGEGENEEDPWIENEEDPWIKSKLKHFKQKGIM